MSLTDDLVDMLKDIFGDNLEASQRYDKATRLMSMIMETSRGLHELIGGEKVDGF